MRNITASMSSEYEDAFNALLTNPETLEQLVAILNPSVSKQNIPNKC